MSCLLCFKPSPAGLPHRRLACGHHVCPECLEDRGQCPVCLRKAVEEVEPMDVDCQPDCSGCRATRGGVYCATCFCLHCVECDAFYHSKVFSRRHSRLPAHLSAGNKTLKLRAECVCHLKPLSYFCTECEIRVCEDCVTPDALSFRTTGRKGGGLDGGEHCGHSYLSLSEAFTQVLRPQIEGFLTPLSEQMRIAELLLRNIRVRVCRLQQEEQEATQGMLTALHKKEQQELGYETSTETEKRKKESISLTQTCLGDDCKAIMEEYNSQHKSKDEAGGGVSAMTKIDQEFREITRLLHERYTMLVQNVQRESRDKIIKLHHQGHTLHEFHTALFVLRHDHLQQLQKGRDLKLVSSKDGDKDNNDCGSGDGNNVNGGDMTGSNSDKDGGGDIKLVPEIASLLEWAYHSIRKSDSLLQIDLLDEVGHLAAPSIPCYFPPQTPIRMLTFGTVGGPAPPEHLRCIMAHHDTYAQAVTLSWTSSEALRDRRRREAKLRLRKHRSHHQTTLFDPYESLDEAEVEELEELEEAQRDDELEFGSSSSEGSDDIESVTSGISSSTPPPSPRANQPLAPSDPESVFLEHDEMVNLVYALDTTKLRDLETIEKEVARAAARPVKAIASHVVEMRVLRGERGEGTGGVGGSHSHSYDAHGGSGEEVFKPLAEVAAPHSHLDVNISQYPNCCLQFRISAVTQEGNKGEYSVVLSFFTPRVFSHECSYKEEKGPFSSGTGLFYLLGTEFGQHAYRNPYASGAVHLTASALESGKLHSFVSEGYDGDLVVKPASSSPSFLSLTLTLPSFLHHHQHDRGHGNAWIEVDISPDTSAGASVVASGLADKDGEAKGHVIMLIPDYYCLRSASGVGGKPRSWVLEGCREKPPSIGAEGVGGVSTHSHDSISSSSSLSSSSSSSSDGNGDARHSPWVLLSEHKNDTSLAPTHCSTAAWPICSEGTPTVATVAEVSGVEKTDTATDSKKKKEKKASLQKHHNNAYRYFRIVNTGNNSTGGRNLECSGFELHGRVVLVAPEEDKE